MAPAVSRVVTSAAQTGSAESASIDEGDVSEQTAQRQASNAQAESLSGSSSSTLSNSSMEMEISVKKVKLGAVGQEDGSADDKVVGILAKQARKAAYFRQRQLRVRQGNGGAPYKFDRSQHSIGEAARAGNASDSEGVSDTGPVPRPAFKPQGRPPLFRRWMCGQDECHALDLHPRVR